MQTLPVSGKPRAGDQVLIGPSCGVHGWGEPFWALVVDTRPALSERHVYVRCVAVDELEQGRVRTFYCQLRGMRVRREVPEG